MSRYLNQDGPKATQFRPRQSSYLRISPTSVLQMTLYLEAAHVEWMSDATLEKMLLALKDRIPLKVEQDKARATGKGGKERRQVDVYRGTDYQMAFFFRPARDGHVVLLKDKNIHFVTRSPSTVRAPSRAAPSPFPPPPPPRKRARTASAAPRDDEGDVLSSGSDGETSSTAAPPSKRRVGVAASGARDEGGAEDELVVVKPEPDEEAPPPGWADSAGGGLAGDVKQEIDEDAKPEVTVTYRGFSIYCRTLVVIVEPYPALDPADLARPRLLNTEIRQLSASVAPESYRNGRSTIPRDSSLSVTPAPRAPSGRGALFRSETTPAESVGGSVAPSELGDGDEGEGDDEQMRRLREMSMMLANDEDEDLPSLDQLAGRAKGSGNVEGAPHEVDGDDEEGTT